MPFVSKKQYRWAFASGQPWARRWARETPSLTKLPAQAAKASEDLATAPAAAPAGAPTKPSGKMTPSERARYAALIRWEKLKAQGKQPGGKGKAKAKAPAGPSAEEVAAATANEIEQAGRGLDKDSLGALQAFAEGGPLDESKAERLSNLGLIEKDRDGNYRATSDGTSVANAARSGNTRQALDSLSRASDKMGKRAEAEASRQAKEKAAEEAKKKEAEKKKGGGGGGGKKDEEKKKEEEKAAAEAAAKEKEEARKKAIERLKGQIDKAKMGYKLNPYEQVEAVTLGLGTFDNAGNFTPTKDVETKAEDGFTPPQAVQAAARRALEQRAEQSPSNRGGTPVGLARARDLANGRSLSMGTVRRMKAFFDRHRGTKPTVAPVEDSKWEQAWGLWGGNAGYRWAQSVVNRAEAKANEPTNPELWAESIREAKKRFRVYPSAYANAWAARRYKQKGGSWRSSATKDLREWFAEEWVDISRPKDGGGYEVCGRPTEGMNQAEYRERYPKCLPKKRAMKLTEAQRLRLIRRKRRTGLPEEGKPTMTSSSTKGYLWKSEENDVAVKHGKHNQASHGRRTGRRRAYNAAYSQARAGGATPQEARALAKEAGLARQAERDARLERLQARGGVKGRIGTKTVAYGDDPNKPYTLTHRLMDMSEVTASNLSNGAVNPKYDAELQPRDRTRAASQMQIDQVAKKLNPDVMVLDTHAIDRGTPIIDANGNVLSGNGRTLALQRAAEMHPDRYAAYREKVREDAKKLGIDPREVDKMQNPVLVRQVDPTVDRVAFAREANAPAVLGMSRMEQAAVDSKILSDRAVSGLVVREGQDIDRALRSPDNKPVVDGLLNKLPPNERARLMTRDGTLNQDGLYRVKAALYTKTFDSEAGSRMAESMLESLDPDLKNVQNGISGSLPSLSRAKSLIRSGDRDRDLDITDDFSSAVDRLARVRASPRFGNLPTNQIVSNYLDQMKTQMFDEDRIAPSERRMLVWLDRNSRKPTAVRDMLNRYSDIVERQASPKQTDFGGGFGRLTRGELLDSLFGADADEGPSQGSLF